MSCGSRGISRSIARLGWCAVALVPLIAPGFAVGGGGAHNVVVIIDPSDADSKYLGNYYVNTRRIPARNVVYLELAASDYAGFVNHQIEAVWGELANRGLTGQVDYVVCASSQCYRLPAAGYVSDPSCSGVSYVSLSSAFTAARLGNAILAGSADEGYGLSVVESNGYFSENESAVAFEYRNRL